MLNILTWKHWQIFLGLCIVPFFVVLFISFFASMQQSMLWGAWVQFLSVSAFALWLYFTGKQLHARFPSSIKVPLAGLRIALLAPIAFMGFIAAGFTKDYIIHGDRHMMMHRGTNILTGQIFFFLALLGMLYAMYFVARSIKTIEEGRRIPFSRCIDMFLGLLFFPVGIWVVAPRLNNIATKPNETEIDIFNS